MAAGRRCLGVAPVSPCESASTFIRQESIFLDSAVATQDSIKAEEPS